MKMIYLNELLRDNMGFENKVVYYGNLSDNKLSVGDQNLCEFVEDNSQYLSITYITDKYLSLIQPLHNIMKKKIIMDVHILQPTDNEISTSHITQEYIDVIKKSGSTDFIIINGSIVNFLDNGIQDMIEEIASSLDVPILVVC